MKNLILTLVALVALVFAPGWAAAQSTATGIAGANAGASSSVDAGNAFGAAGIAGAMCTDGFVLGPIGVTTTIRDCIRLNVLEQGGRFGTLTRGEIRAGQLAILENQGMRFGTPAATETASTRAPAPAAVAPSAPAPADAMQWVRSCAFQADGRTPEVRIHGGLSVEQQQAAVAACMDQLG